MFGFFCCASAAGGEATPKSVATVANARLILPDHFINALLFFFSSVSKFGK